MKDNHTAIVVVLDKSSSMQNVVKETISSFNTFIAEQKKLEGTATLTFATFNHEYDLVHDYINLATAPDLDSESYKTSGYTSLLDAMGKTINSVGNKLASMPEEERPSKVLFLVMTDGAENSSVEFKDPVKIFEMVTHQKEKYNWEFVYIGANQDAIMVGSTLGVAAVNSYNYTSNSAGTKDIFGTITRGTTSYRSGKGFTT